MVSLNTLLGQIYDVAAALMADPATPFETTNFPYWVLPRDHGATERGAHLPVDMDVCRGRRQYPHE